MIITAHSGPDGTEDNTLSSIRYCLQSGVEAFEVDIRAFQGELVLGHDELKDGSTPATLQEAFEIMKEHPSIRMNCDLKHGGLEYPVFELAKSFGLESRLIFTGAVSIEEVAEHPELSTTATVFYNIEGLTERFYDRLGECWEDAKAVKNVLRELDLNKLKAVGIHGVNVYYGVCIDVFMELMDQNGLHVSAWTVDNMEELGRLLQYRGIESITTNKVKEAIALVRMNP